ncbi:hypothetical protein AG4045_010847, partial [Apium graveolens]
MGTTSFNDFPKETTAEILLRLPVKDLIRSTSVSKTWYSLITDPSFISDQIRKAVSCCNHNSLLIIPTNTSHQNYCSLISTDTSSLFEKFDIPFQTNTRTLKLVTETHRVLVSSCFKKPLDALFTTYCVAGMELGTPLDITKNEALILEAIRSRDLDVTSIISCDLKTMIHKDHGFGKSMDPDVSIFDLDPSTVDNSFPESLI